MNKKLVALVVIVLAIAAVLCIAYKPAKPASNNPWGTTPDQYVTLGTFKGTLPCADCPGLDTTLTLTQYGKDIAEGIYTLDEFYRERSTSTVRTTGNWTTIRGDKQDENAVVYELNPASSHPRDFVKVDENTIEQLDGEGNVINAPGINFKLKRQ